jgi:hypothetical protein
MEDEISKILIDQADPVSSQMKRFFGTKNKMTVDANDDPIFEDVWDYNRFSSGEFHGIIPNTPRLIFQVSRKIFNNGKMFELHFATHGKRNIINNTRHYTHYVGYNGYYVVGVYDEETKSLEWKNSGDTIFDVHETNPHNLNTNLDLSSVNFTRDLISDATDKRGVITFRENELSPYHVSTADGFYHYAYYKGEDDFTPEDYNNWHMVKVDNLEYIMNDSAVTTDDSGNVDMWICGDGGVIIHSQWDDGFDTNSIQNIDPAHPLYTKEINTVTSSNLNSIFFIDKDTANAPDQAGKYGWAVGANGTVLITTDGGTNWVAIEIESDLTCNKVIFYNKDNGFITSNKGIWKSSDGGHTWTLDENSKTIGYSTEWKDIVALPERYGLWKHTLLPKVFATTNDLDDVVVEDWESSKESSKYYHKSTVAIGAAPLEVEVASGEIRGTPIAGDPNMQWPTRASDSGDPSSREGTLISSEIRDGYTFYPSNKIGLHLYDPSKHLREDR